MKRLHRSFLLAFVSAAFIIGTSAQATNWSDPASWPNHKVPVAGDKVTIGRDKQVVLDVSPPALGGLSIDGKLTFSNDADLTLTTEWIMLHGDLAIGTEANPYTHKATIILTDNVKGEDVMGGMGDRGIMIAGGTLNLHGDRTNTWTKLAQTAKAGSDSIEVLNAAEWRVGDEIVLASTDFNPRQAERRTIAAVSGNKITIDKKLEYMHFGKVTFDVDERGEVANLTRNIKVEASTDAEQTFFGGHIMAMPSSHMYVEGVELNRMGQNLTLARYPIHWHVVGDAKGQYVRNASIHDTYNRCVTVHGTNESKDVLLPSDNTVSSYWITNPDNTYRDNVAAGSDANGFWLSLPEHPQGQFEGTDLSKTIWPRRTQFHEFKGNVAHSNYDGFMFDRNINANNTFGVTGNSQTGLENPADPNSKVVVSVFENLTTYKNRNNGVWGRGEAHLFRNIKFADNAIGFTHAAGGARFDYSSKVLDSLFVGETENVGNPGTPEEKAYGRTFPKPTMPDYPIRGYEFYDYRHDVVNTTFRNYQDNATRKTGAISHLLYTSFGASSNNAVENVKFINAKPVYYPLMEKKWGNDNNAGSLAYKTAVFRDRDGSLGMGPNSFVVINDGVNDSIAVDTQDCEIKKAWNAAVCKGDVGRMSFADGHGLGFNPISRAPPGEGALPPVILSRKGVKDISIPVGANVRSGIEFKATTERTSMDLNVIELDAGSWVIVEIPGFTKAASGTQQSSLEALRKASATSYYKAGDALWVKLVSTGDDSRGMGGGVSLQVSR